jgi:hypothetical protein
VLGVAFVTLPDLKQPAIDVHLVRRRSRSSALGGTQAMPEGDPDHCVIAKPC